MRKSHSAESDANSSRAPGSTPSKHIQCVVIFAGFLDSSGQELLPLVRVLYCYCLENPCGRLSWNPTFAHRTRKGGAPVFEFGPIGNGYVCYAVLDLSELAAISLSETMFHARAWAMQIT